MFGDSVDLSAAITEYGRGETRKMDFILNKITMSTDYNASAKEFFVGCSNFNGQFPENLAYSLFDLFLISKPWHSFVSDIAENCLLLLVNIATQYEQLAQQLLSNFCATLFSSSLYSSSSADADTSEIVFKALREFLNSLPHFESQFIGCLERTLPSWGRPTPQLFTALANALRLCYETPQLLSPSSIQQLLCFCFTLLIDIEVNIEPTITSSAECPLSKLSLPFDVDHFTKNKQLIFETLSDKSPPATPLFWLSVMSLSLIFPGGNSELVDQSAKKRRWAFMCAVFRDMRTRFFHRVLPVQSAFAAYPLLLIYMCSLRPGLVVNFLESLWKFVKDTRQPNEVRVRCLNYLADYLARSNHVSNEIIVEQLHDMAAWCVEYTYFRRNRLSSQFKKMFAEHTLFYIIFESIVFVLTYRQIEIIGTPKYRHSCTFLPLGQLINCPFKPLDRLTSGLRSHFLAVSFAYKMNWTSSLVPEIPSELDPCPMPSFTCPFSEAAATFPITSHLSLLRDFVQSKRTRKRPLENDAASSSNGALEYPSVTNKRINSRTFKPRHFNFNALADIT
ncbi:unnamed protein product [Mesocestoides corti]|uniref:RNA polymerase I-specific transcription initiation factor RRN3 n=1 Tax=Mesocestoides corti TaxID=53468 RepID=A0A0R3UB32_MESCO|nr:unnamed protein product [Mesocestoides corti]